jgi:hypothetical protein
MDKNVMSIPERKFRWAALFMSLFVQALAQDFSAVPGTVVSYIEAPDYRDRLLDNEIFPASPSMTLMPDGSYVASHDLFYESGDEDNRYTWIFRSTDKGQTWTKQAEVSDAFWSTIFEHNGDLYLWGYRDGGSESTGDILIRRSSDNGVTWTDPVDEDSGFLRDGDYGGTPNTPGVYGGRIWIAQSGKRVMSAPVDADLLKADSWTLSSTANTSAGPFASDVVISESQVVASPQTGVVLLPKVGEYPNTVLLRVSSTSAITDPADADWVSLPGGEKKFGAQYDDVSGRFYILNNPVLPVHPGDATAALTRTTAAILSSRDLVNWDLEKIFLFTSNINNGTWGEGFQYFQFVIDDVDQDGQSDDLAVISRTAFDVGGGEEKPRRAHDSNMITFHEISNFRTAEADFYIKIESGEVNRYEYTQNEDAVLGGFALGSSFDGSVLTDPTGLSADYSAGSVFIREAAGRILKFDMAGNFLGTISSLPSGLSWNTTKKGLNPPGRENRTWINEEPGGGSWSDPSNWFYWGRPDTADEIATFGSALADGATITVDETCTVKGLRFLGGNDCLFSGEGSLQLTADADESVVDVQSGSHGIQLPVFLNTNASFMVHSDAVLTVEGEFGLNGNLLDKSGSGTLRVENGGMGLGDSRLRVREGSVQLVNTRMDVNGTIELPAPEGFVAYAGKSCQILAGDLSRVHFDQVILPDLEDGLSWDTSMLYSNGTVTIVRRVPDAWMEQYNLPTDGSADFLDPDEDGMTNYAEWRAGTNPTDKESLFKVQAITANSGFKLQWSGLSNRTYRVEYSTNLLMIPAFTELDNGLIGSNGVAEFAVTNAASIPNAYFRISVE